MRTSTLASPILLLLLWQAWAAAEETNLRYRKWTHANGKNSVRAAFVELVDGQLKLKRESDGKVISLPVEQLSRADAVLAAHEEKRRQQPKPSPPKVGPAVRPPAAGNEPAAEKEAPPKQAAAPQPLRRRTQRRPAAAPAPPNGADRVAVNPARWPKGVWPGYVQEIGVGRCRVHVINLTEQRIGFGLRRAQSGKNFEVAAKAPEAISTAATLNVPEGEYDIIFRSADAPNKLLPGGRIVVGKDAPSVHVLTNFNGQFAIQHVNLANQAPPQPDDIVIPGAIIPQPDIVIPGAMIPQPDLVIPGATIPQPSQNLPNGVSIPQPPIRMPDTRIPQPPLRLPDTRIPQPPLRLPDIRIPRPKN